MITLGIMKILHDAIQIYDRLCGKNYLIVFGSKKKYKFIQLTIRQSSFWHLLGCCLEEDTKEEKHNTYSKCKNKEDISNKVSSIHNFSEIEAKYLAMKNVFDFVSKANEIKICYTKNCPEEYLFKVGTGNNVGVIGYDYPNDKSSNLLFPKSAQLKSISKIARDSERVLMILSKRINEKHYNNIEYEIKKNIYSELIKHIPSDIRISSAIN